MRPPPRKTLGALLATIVSAFSLFTPVTAIAGGVGVSVEGHNFEVEGLGPQHITTKAFRPYVVPTLRNPYASRDVQFHWSDTYVAKGARLDSLVSGQTDLDRLGITVCGTSPAANPFGYNLSDVNLVVDYLNFVGTLYNSTDLQSPGFLVTPLDPFDLLNASYYSTIDRNHIDTYVYYPDSLVGGVAVPSALGDNTYGTNNRGACPSDFLYTAEDSIEGRAPTLDSLRVSNSFSMAGPLRWQVGDTGPSVGPGPIRVRTGCSATNSSTRSTDTL